MGRCFTSYPTAYGAVASFFFFLSRCCPFSLCLHVCTSITYEVFYVKREKKKEIENKSTHIWKMLHDLFIYKKETYVRRSHLSNPYFVTLFSISSNQLDQRASYVQLWCRFQVGGALWIQAMESFCVYIERQKHYYYFVFTYKIHILCGPKSQSHICRVFVFWYSAKYLLPNRSLPRLLCPVRYSVKTLLSANVSLPSVPSTRQRIGCKPNGGYGLNTGLGGAIELVRLLMFNLVIQTKVRHASSYPPTTVYRAQFKLGSSNLNHDRNCCHWFAYQRCQ